MKDAYVVVSKCRLMCRAVAASRNFKTVRAGEIAYAYRAGTGLQ